MADDAQRIADCRDLYIKYGGRQHEQIEREMSANGHARFRRRIMYTRRERGRVSPGWIDRFGWKKDIDAILSPKGTKIIAQDKATGRDPGYDSQHNSDPEGVEQPTGEVAPLQGANDRSTFPGVTLASLVHPRLLSLSPSATGYGSNSRLTKIKTNRQKARRLRKESLQSSRVPELQSFQDDHAPNSATLQLRNSANSPTDDFHAWLKTQPGMWNWDWRHQLYIYQYLKRVTEGKCTRLMIFMPPRHGKSELVTVRYSAWRLRRDPSLKVILAGYNQSLANNFSRKIKNVLCDDWSASIPACMDATASRTNADSYATTAIDTHNAGGTGVASKDACAPVAASPFPFTRTRPKNCEAEWETTMGGGLRAVGVGGGVTGFGANLIVIDDPVKSRAEAESAKIREKIWDWFNDDIYTRLEPNGAIILIQTRWHEDDLAGRLLREMEDGGEQWEIVNLPALAEEGEMGRRREGEKRGKGEDEMNGNGGETSIKGTKIIGWAQHPGRETSPQGTRILAQGEAGGRDPGCSFQNSSDPEGVEQPTGEVAPLQGANDVRLIPGVTLPLSAHPRLLSLSPSATGEPQSNDPLNRKPGEALCPERFNVQDLENLQRQLGTYSFSALYQQRPTPAEGMIFKREWFAKIIKQPPPDLKWTRGYDLAVSTKTTADYTASFRAGFDADGNLYIDGGFRKRIEFPERRRYILGRIAAEHDTEHGIELALHGQGIMQDLRRQARLQGRRFRGIAVEGDKLTRALKWSSLAEEGKVILVRGGWNADFIDEACSFPGGQFDDQIDAVSIAVRMHEKQGGRLIRF